MSRAQQLLEKFDPNHPLLTGVKSVAKKVTSGPSASDIVKGSSIPASKAVKTAGKTVSSVASNPQAAKKVAHALVGSAALAAATGALAGRRRRKRREREMSYRGSSGYYE